MTTSKKRKSTNLHITCPAAPRARNIRLRRNNNNRPGSSTTHIHAASGSLGTALPEHIEPTDLFTDFTESQTNDDPDDPADADTDIGDKSKRHKRAKFIGEWLKLRDTYVKEMLRHDGRQGRQETFCEDCKEIGNFSCDDCSYNMHFCQDCLVNSHRIIPLHRIRRWTGFFYEKTSLQSLGLVIRLGHDGPSCPSPGPVHKDFIVVDLSGIHTVNVQFCECHNSDNAPEDRASYIQLLRFCYFPSTIARPQSAFTFDILNTFHLLTLQGKVSAFNFYCTLQKKTDNTGLSDAKQSVYRQFLTAIRLWRHLKSLKRSGRGHDPTGANGTQPGECAVECPACPHPHRNLPPDWIDARDSRRWLYSLNLTIDANFRLKNKARGIEDDPLGDGWGHWVPNEPYQKHIKEYGYQKEPNLCDSELHAVDHANSRFSKGYIATGVGGIVCARHGLVRKNGMGDLQKGERYANMDFILFNSLIGSENELLVFSYDIACQWSRKLSQRQVQLPGSMRLSERQLHLLRFAIPKFHISAHGLDCQATFSFNYQPYMARTDGEDPERWWAHINPVSMSTKEMSPGSRIDTLDDHAGAWNWRKIIGFGTSLMDQLKEAITTLQLQQENHTKFSASFLSETTRKWQDMVEEWNRNPKASNPYIEPITSTSTVNLRLETAKEQVTAFAETGADQPHEMTPAVLIQNGLDLEDQQILVRQARTARTTHELAKLEEQRNVLRRRLNTWMEARNLYIPLIPDGHTPTPSIESSDATPADQLPDTMPLKLPSELPASLQKSCGFGLVQLELRFRLAQAEDSLFELRRLLRIKMSLGTYKSRQIGPSQRGGTRALTLIHRFTDKVSRCAERYRAAHKALLALDPMGEWQTGLRELKEEDVQAPGRGDHESEGFRKISWIWLDVRRLHDPSPEQSGPLSDEELDDCLRCEWVKSKARMDRWKEEVELVREEMRRVLAFLEWKAVWWTEKGRRDLNVRPDVADGIRAYAAKQASINRALAHSFKTRWESAFETQHQDHGQDDGNEYMGDVGKRGEGEFDSDVD